MFCVQSPSARTEPSWQALPFPDGVAQSCSGKQESAATPGPWPVTGKSSPSRVARAGSSVIDLLDTNILIHLIKNRPPHVARRIDALSRQVTVLFPEADSICRNYAQQAAALKRQSTLIGANDLWIACPALALGATPVSHNQREFRRVA